MPKVQIEEATWKVYGHNEQPTGQLQKEERIEKRLKGWSQIKEEHNDIVEMSHPHCFVTKKVKIDLAS